MTGGSGGWSDRNGNLFAVPVGAGLWRRSSSRGVPTVDGMAWLRWGSEIQQLVGYATNRVVGLPGLPSDSRGTTCVPASAQL
jgi:hypothetical protein